MAINFDNRQTFRFLLSAHESIPEKLSALNYAHMVVRQ